MKKFIKRLIERLESRYVNKKYKNQNPKILSTVKNLDFKVSSPHGFDDAPFIHLTKPFFVFKVITFGGHHLECADHHLIKTPDRGFVNTNDLNPGDKIITEGGEDTILTIESKPRKIPMYDLTIENESHSYFTNDILSHNTITTSLYILHYLLFNMERRKVLILSNYGKTTEELMTKIKDMYLTIPFHLRRGVKVWNKTSITFNNDSQLDSRKTNKSNTAGITADLLYIDEFALIEDNILKDFYDTVVPTLSSMDNSQMIITTTPRGRNLFYDMYRKAKEGEGMFKLKEIYWHDIKGKTDTKIYYDTQKDNPVTLTELIDALINKGHLIRRITKVGYEYLIYVIYKNATSTISHLRKMKIDDRKLLLTQFTKITNFKEEQIDLLNGDIDRYNREYELKFEFSDKGLFDSGLIHELNEKSVKFVHYDIPLFNKFYDYDYSRLTWIEDRNLLNIKYEEGLFELDENDFFIVSIDMAPGLESDYTVANIFKIDLMEESKIQNIEKFDTIYDFFTLRQVGIYRSNNTSIQDFAKIVYLLCFELMNSMRMKIQLELNGGYGEHFLSELKNINRGNSKYDESAIFRFFHKQTDKHRKKGYRVTAENKNINIQDFRNMIHNGKIIPHSLETIDEMNHFVRKETRYGNSRYEAEGDKHDDIIMTMVNLAPLKDNYIYKDMLDQYYEESKSNPDMQDTIKLIEEKLNQKEALGEGNMIGDGFYSGIAEMRDKFVENTGFFPNKDQQFNVKRKQTSIFEKNKKEQKNLDGFTQGGDDILPNLIPNPFYDGGGNKLSR